MPVASLTTSNEAWGRNPHAPAGFAAARVPSASLPLLRDDSHRGRRGASQPTPRRHERDPCYDSDTLLARIIHER